MRELLDDALNLCDSRKSLVRRDFLARDLVSNWLIKEVVDLLQEGELHKVGVETLRVVWVSRL